MRVVVASNNPVKLAATKEAFDAYFPEVRVDDHGAGHVLYRVNEGP